MEHYVRTIHKPTQVASECSKSPDKLSSYLSTLNITPPSHLKEAFASYRYERRNIVKSPPSASTSVENSSTYDPFYRPSYFAPIVRRANVIQQHFYDPIHAAPDDENAMRKREFQIARVDQPIRRSASFHTSKPWKELMDIEEADLKVAR